MAAWKAHVEIRPWPEGGYIAEVPDLQGCWVVADTVDEALRDILDGIEMSIESRLKVGEPLPPGLEEVKVPSDGERIALDVAVAVG